MSSRDPTVNVTYGIMTMLYLTTVVVLNTLNIRLYEQEVLIPLQQGPEKALTVAKVAPPQQVATSTTANTSTTGNTGTTGTTGNTGTTANTGTEENFGNITAPQETKIETTTVRTTKINKEAVAITESILMGLTLPLAFGYIIGFDCSCPPNDDHVGKIIFCLGVFIPMIFIIVNEIISLLFPDIDVLNPFLPPGSSDVEGKKHFFNKQYRKTFCWCLVTFTFIIHFFSVAFGQQTGVGSVDVI